MLQTAGSQSTELRSLFDSWQLTFQRHYKLRQLEKGINEGVSPSRKKVLEGLFCDGEGLTCRLVWMNK